MKELISAVTALPLCAYATREKEELNGKIVGDTVRLESSVVLVVKKTRTFIGYLLRTLELLYEDGDEREKPESCIMWMDVGQQEILDVDPDDFWAKLPNHPNG